MRMWMTTMRTQGDEGCQIVWKYCKEIVVKGADDILIKRRWMEYLLSTQYKKFFLSIINVTPSIKWNEICHHIYLIIMIIASLIFNWPDNSGVQWLAQKRTEPKQLIPFSSWSAVEINGVDGKQNITLIKFKTHRYVLQMDLYLRILLEILIFNSQDILIAISMILINSFKSKQMIKFNNMLISRKVMPKCGFITTPKLIIPRGKRDIVLILPQRFKQHQRTKVTFPLPQQQPAHPEWRITSAIAFDIISMTSNV